jgi:predicted DCC family thiol-disulfide oxidoreductase YuxK
MTPELYRACQEAVHVITPAGRILRAGRASLFILQEVGYPRWLIRPLSWPPLVWLVELGYQLVAQNRSFFSKFLFTRE